MAIVHTPARTADGQTPPAARDSGIDLLRAVCVAGVVLLHAIMVGVTVSEGGPVFTNASDGTWWIVPVSWTLQVMPLFFIIGGYSGLLAFRKLRARGGAASDFVAGRVHRLLAPAVVVIGVVGVLLLALQLAGVPADLVEIAGFRYGQPLWFLGVFLLCQALLPVLAHAHARAPRTTLAVLVAAAPTIDALRALTGVDGIGILNLAFVWLALQQAGFLVADGSLERIGRPVRAAIAALSVAALLALVAAGVYSPDLIANLNPPTCALLLVGAAHLAIVSLLREPLRALSRRPMVARFSAFVTQRTMTIYLWHMPVLLAMAGASAVVASTLGLSLPEPSSPLWWLSRPVWLAAALALTAGVAVAVTRFETRAAPRPSGSRRRLVSAVTMGIAAIVMLLIMGTSTPTAIVATVVLVTALRLAKRSAEPAGGQGVPDVVRVA